MIKTINNVPVQSGNSVVKSLFFSGINPDPLEMITQQKKSYQEFVRDEVFIDKSIDPYQYIVNANKIIASGESLFFNDNNANKRK